MRHRWVFAIALLLSSGTALGQPKGKGSDQAKKEAIVIADKAVEAFRNEKYQEAVDGFRAADQKFHVPKFLLYVARSQMKLGKLLDAKATFHLIVDEKLASYAPDEFFTAQADAKKELAELEGRIPSVRIEINGVPAGQAATVTLDGAVVAAADLGKPLQRDPGAHAIVVDLPGRPQIVRQVTLREGGSESVILEMSAATVVPTAAPTATAVVTVAPQITQTPSTAAPAATAAPSSGGGVPTLTIVSYAVGGAGLIAGAVCGGLALGKHTEFNETPTKEALDQGRMFSLIADIGFGTAVVGAAVGTVYWLVSRPKAAQSQPSSKTGVFIAPTVGTTGGGVSLSGRF